MSLLAEMYKNPFKYLFFGILILYILLYGPYGIEDGDMGSIFGISWSMYNGYFPHRDFVYIKPAFAPFFHSLPLYITEEYAYLINRYGYFVQVFLYSYWAAAILFKLLNLPKKWLYLIALIGALVSIHNYPPMPWNTVDGLFFSVLGCYVLVMYQQKVWQIALGVVFLCLGALCKQSFFFFPLFLAGYFIVQRSWRTLWIYCLSGLTFAGLFLVFFWYNNALDSFVNQLFSFTPGSSLIDRGVRSYYLGIKFHIIYIVIALLGFVLVKKFTTKSIQFLYVNLVVALTFISLYYYYQSFYGTIKFGVMHILWVIGVLYTLFKVLSDSKYSILLALLGLAWCASISNGFNTPVDFSTPMILVIVLLAVGENLLIKKWVAYAALVLYLGTFFYGYQYPYRESPRKALTYNLGELYPQLNSIKTDAEGFEKYQELKALTTQYQNFTILPSMTLGHYVTNTINPIGIDWVLNHHLADQLEAYKQQLVDENITVFLENFEGHIDNYEESSLLTVYVAQNWQLVAHGKHFRVYQRP